MWKLIPEEIIYVTIVLGFVIFGALAHAFNALRSHTDQKVEFNRRDFFILAFLATFSGMFFGLLTFGFVTQNIVLVTLFSGLGSFTGIVGLNKVTSVALDFFTGLLGTIINKK